MTLFAIYRHEKHKNAGTVAVAANHMTRESDTPNADPGRAHLNRVFIGTADPAADVAALVPPRNALNDQGHKVRRSNSVIAIEILLTTSPGWPKATPEQQQDWVDRSTAWLVHEYGRENIAHLRLHADEQTPHLTGFIVPIDPDTERLNSRRWIGGKERCAKQQTDYAATVAHLGLSRGIEGSTAKHERVRRHYRQIAQPVASLAIDRPPRVLMDPEGWAAEQAQSIARQAAPAFARARPPRATGRPRRPPRRRPRRTGAGESGPKPNSRPRRPFPPACAPFPCPMCWTPWGSARTPARRAGGGPRASTSR